MPDVLLTAPRTARPHSFPAAVLLLITGALASSCTSTPTKSVEDEARLKPGFTVTPRLWLAFTGLTQDDDLATESAPIPMAGSTITWTPDSDSGWSFLLTALFGSGTADNASVPAGTAGEQDIDRSDLEFLARYNLEGSNVFVHFGVRYIQFDTDGSAGSLTFEEENRVLFPQIGVSLVSDVDPEGNSRLFGNLSLGLALNDFEYSSNAPFQEDGDSAALGIDTNFGWLKRLSDGIGLNLRYRAFVFGNEDDFELRQYQVFHGPEIGVSINL